MTSSIGHLLLLSLLFLFLSLQTHARESHFFSKASLSEASTLPIADEPAMVLPPQSRNGYGLYGDIDHSPPTTTITTTNNFPSTSADTEYKERSNANAIPSTTMTAFSNEFSSHEQPNANTIPSTLSNELNHHGSTYETKAPDYFYNKESDTRLLDNGKYSYDVNSEGYNKEYRPMKENAEGYRTYVESRGGNYVNGGGYGNGDNSRRNGYMYKNEMAEYPKNQADYENLEEYVP